MPINITGAYVVGAGQTITIADSPGINFQHPYPYNNSDSLTNAGTITIAPPSTSPFATGIGGGAGSLPPVRGFVWNQAGGAINVIATGTTRAFGLTYTGLAGTDFTNDGLFNVSAQSEATGIFIDDDTFTFVNNGTFQVQSANSDSLGFYDLNGCAFTNNGDYEVSGSAGSIGLLYGGFDFSFTNTGNFTVSDTVHDTIGIESYHLDSLEAVFTNSGTISADIAFITLDYYFSPPGQPVDIINNSGTIHGLIFTGLGDDEIHNTGRIFDTVYLEDGNDLYDGAGGHEFGGVDGGGGNDTLHGGTDGDLLAGGDGNDVLDGGPGDDFLFGGTGDDVITGGAGQDVLTGGTGRDRFVYTSVSDLAGDLINDFDPTADDIDLSAIPGLTFIGTGPFTGVTGQVRYVSGNGQTILTIDSNGDGIADATLAMVGEFALTETAPGSRIIGQASSDFTPPYLIAMSPFDNTRGEPVNGKIVLKFLEPVRAGSGTIDIYKVDNSLFASIPVTDTTQVTFSGDTVTIDPAADFAAQTYYYVDIQPNVITDLAGNSFSGIPGEPDDTSGERALDFTTGSPPPPPDTTPPKIAGTIPDPFTLITVNSNLVMQFDENVKPGSGNLEIRERWTSVLLESIPITDTSQVTFSGTKVTINPSVDLSPNTTYAVICGSGVILDSAGNPFPGMGHQGDANSFVFTTVNSSDTTPPQLLSVSPPDDSTGVPLNANIVLTFDEPVRKGSGEFRLTSTNSFYSRAFYASDPQVSYSGNTVTINPYSDFQPGINFYLTIDPYAVLDTAGNGFAGVSSTTAFNFTTLDSTPPSLSATTPSDNAANVLPSTNISMLFSEAIKPGSGSIEIHNSDGSLFASYSVTDSAHVSFSGSLVTVNPDIDLAPFASYYVLVAPGAITDMVGNAFAGVTSPTALNFSTGKADQTPPSLSDRSPWFGSGVPVDANIVLVFSEPVVAGSGQIVVSSGAHVQTISIYDTSQVSIVGNIVTINPNQDLDSNSSVYVTIDSGFVQDLAGNPFPGSNPNVPWEFTTAPAPQTTAPVLLGTSPADNATNVAPNLGTTITLTFDHSVKAGPGHVHIYNQDGSLFETLDSDEVVFDSLSDTVRLVPHSGLGPARQYYVTIDSNAIEDYSGNYFAGFSSPTALNFSTSGNKDKVTPTLGLTSPDDNSTENFPITGLLLAFSEPVLPASGNIEIRRISDGSVFESVPVTDPGRLQWVGRTLHVNLPTPIPLNSTGYYLFILPGVFVDTSGNPFAGVTFPSQDNFFSGALPNDTTPPTFTGTSPPGLELGNLSIHDFFYLNFSENIEAGNGNIEIHRSADGSLFETIPASDTTRIQYNDGILLYNLGLEPDTAYYILITPGTVTDLAGNPFAGVSSPTAITLKTAPALPGSDGTRPTLSSTLPSDNASRVGASANLVFTFSEPVMPGAGYLEIHNADGSLFDSISVSDASQVNFAGTTVTIDPNISLSLGPHYVLIAPGVIQDVSGNIFAGITSPTAFNFTSVPGPVSDFNGNSKSDILWQNDDGRACVWLMNGAALSSWSLAGANPGTAWHVKAATDFNGDGKADILWQNADGTPAIWFMNGTTSTGGGIASLNPGSSWHIAGTGDFNGDGKADILWQSTDGTPAIWLMNGTSLVSGGLLLNPGTAWHAVGTGDFDGDGKSDILWQNANGQAAIWLMNGSTLSGGGLAGPNPGTTWHAMAAGDFDGDGKSDILWQNDNGQAAIWLMNGASLLGGGLVSPNPGPAWTAMGAGDFNGDGKADIVWQNADGSPAVWLMNGTSYVSGASFPSAGASWHVIAMGG